MLGEGRFYLRALSVFPFEKAALHLTPILCLRPFSPVCARVELDDRLAYFQNLARVGVVLFAVKRCIAHAGINIDVTQRLLHQGAPENAIVPGPSSNECPDNEVRGRVAADAKFCPVPLTALFVLVAYAGLVVFAGVTFLKASGINRHTGWLVKGSRGYKPSRGAGRTELGKLLRAAALRGTELNSEARA